MAVNTQGSTQEADIASAQELFGTRKLFLLTKNASSMTTRALQRVLNADSKIGNYALLTEQDLIPKDLLTEAKEAMEALKHDATFWSDIKDQNEIALGAPGNHPNRIAIWALSADATHIWDKHI